MPTETPPTSISPINDACTEYARDVVDGKIVAGPYVRLACQRHLDDIATGSERGLIWDPEKSARSIGYFRDVLTVEVEEDNGEGEFESKSVRFNLQPWQAFIVGSLFGWMTDAGLRRFRRAYVEIGKGNGKALAIDTPIPTPTGWTTMGALRRGDQVFDENGKPCNVTAVSGHMNGRPCYRMTFSDGAEIVADAEHLWKTSALRSQGKRGPKPASEPRKGGYAIRTTEEISRTLSTGPTNSTHPQAKWNHRVDVAGALELTDVELRVRPYTLGAWLGDGDSDCARLTVAYADWAIVREIEADGYAAAEQKKHSPTTARVSVGSLGRSQAERNACLASVLRRIGVIGNKHIPDEYFRASYGQRLALLQGLMDTDGSALKGGASEFTAVNERLARDVCDLMRTLGLKPMMTESAAKLNGREVGRRWRIRVHAYRDTPIFRLKRKAERLKERPKTKALSLGRMIVGCEPIESVTVQCISVDSPSRMFLAGKHLVPTHNSPLAAGIGHYMLTAMGKLRAEVYSAATDKDQASILFRDAVAMWERSPNLRKRLHPSGVNPVWQLTDLQRNSFFKPISSEKKGKSGIRPYCALIDEVHEHADNSVIEMMRAGTKGNQEALIFEITNSGFDKKTVCGQEHDYTVEIIEGTKQNDAWFGFIASLDEGDDPFDDEGCWIKANPNLGISIQPLFIREQVSEAKGMPSKEGLVRRLHFCQWTESENSAIPRKIWQQCKGEVDPQQLCEEYGRPYGGLDLSRARDLTAFTLTWVIDSTKDQWKFASKTWFWTPKDTLVERAKRDRAPYVEWVKAGHIEAVAGSRISYRWIASALSGLCAQYDPAIIGCDQYGLENLQDHLGDIGVALPCVVHPQGFQRRVIEKKEEQALVGATGADEIALWMPDSINKLENALYEQRIIHDPNPVQEMCAASVVYEQNRTGHRMFAKDKAVSRIDGMVSLAMSVGMATVPTAPKREPTILVIG
jgi:phage terminase large subunit-like protein